MKSLDEITKEELIELENRCWMTHDGMWFYSCLSRLGIEEANRLNKSAIRGLAPFEIERTKKAIGFEKRTIETFEDFQAYFTMAAKLFIPPFMKANMSFREPNVLHWEFEPDNCFAYKGIKRLGAIDRYECGVIYRIECWLDSFGIRYETRPKIGGCLMHEHGQCAGDIELCFKPGGSA
jgi:hypothetical protein